MGEWGLSGRVWGLSGECGGLSGRVGGDDMRGRVGCLE